MSKNINLANSKLNNSNIKLKQSYSNAKNANLKVMYMPHWLEFYSYTLHNEVNSTRKRYYKAYSKGTIVYARLGSNIGSEFSGNHFCVVIDNYDNRGKETITIVPLSSKKNSNYLKLSTTILDLTAADLLEQLASCIEKYSDLKINFETDSDKINEEEEKQKKKISNKLSELNAAIKVYSKHIGKDTYVNVSAISTISKKRLSKINNSDPTGKISLPQRDIDEIQKEIKLKFL